jgi:hypothetical protein
MEQNNWELGTAAQNSKLHLYQSGANYDLLHTFTVFGDPTLQIQKSTSFDRLFLPMIRK